MNAQLELQMCLGDQSCVKKLSSSTWRQKNIFSEKCVINADKKR